MWGVGTSTTNLIWDLRSEAGISCCRSPVIHESWRSLKSFYFFNRLAVLLIINLCEKSNFMVLLDWFKWKDELQGCYQCDCSAIWSLIVILRLTCMYHIWQGWGWTRLQCCKVYSVVYSTKILIRAGAVKRRNSNFDEKYVITDKFNVAWC